jgi:hypothetical protein
MESQSTFGYCAELNKTKTMMIVQGLLVHTHPQNKEQQQEYNNIQMANVTALAKTSSLIYPLSQ